MRRQSCLYSASVQSHRFSDVHDQSALFPNADIADFGGWAGKDVSQNVTLGRYASRAATLP
jgi:hypothetical protein